MMKVDAVKRGTGIGRSYRGAQRTARGDGV